MKYTVVSANTFKSFWLHVSTALRPSSGQHIKIKVKALNLYMLILIYLLTAIGLSPGGSSTVHIYTPTIHRTTQNKQ